jgi:hypothetical protein
MSSGAGARGEDGIWTEPISSDQHMRCYLQAWRRCMNAGAARLAQDAANV